MLLGRHTIDGTGENCAATREKSGRPVRPAMNFYFTRFSTVSLGIGYNFSVLAGKWPSGLPMAFSTILKRWWFHPVTPKEPTPCWTFWIQNNRLVFFSPWIMIFVQLDIEHSAFPTERISILHPWQSIKNYYQIFSISIIINYSHWSSIEVGFARIVLHIKITGN